MQTIQFTAAQVAHLQAATSHYVLNDMIEAADTLVPGVDWNDEHEATAMEGHHWVANGNAFVDGEPMDVNAFYAIDRDGNVTAARVTLEKADLDD